MLRSTVNASWPFIDQGVVSVGTFAVNLILARNLSQTEYGVFALLISVFLTLQLLNTSLLFHPLIFSLPSAEARASERVLTATCLLTVCTSLLLAALIGAGLLVLGRGDLVPCALAAFLAAQVQEAARRCLFAQLRHRAALPGDCVSYLGQSLVVLLLVPSGSLSIESALAAMAATSLMGAGLQFGRIRFAPVGGAELRRVVAEFWVIGRWILAYSAVSFLRLQIFPWALAATSGPAAAAMFQASMNVLNIANPVLLGLSNIIPQVAARALHRSGEVPTDPDGPEVRGRYAGCWRAVRSHLLLGLPVALAFYGVVLVVPEAALRALYGARSEYLVLTTAAQILAVSAMLSAGADMLSSFLHGVNAARSALAVNVTGAVVAVALGIPAVHLFGLMGCCVALVGANAVRLGSAQYAISMLTRIPRRRLAPGPLRSVLARSG